MKIAVSLLVLLLGAPVLAVPLTVSVVDDKGAPLVGADVQLESFGKSPRGTVLQQTDDKGTTTFEVEPRPFSPFGDLALAGRVFARKNGFGIASGLLFFKKPLRIELGAPAKVSGKVLDTEGKPISGATISFSSAQKGGKPDTEMLIDGPMLAMMTVRSDKDGAFELPSVPADTQVSLMVSAPERVSQRAQISSGGTGEIVLVPGAQIKGRVLGLDGKPLEGIEIYAQSSNNNFNNTGGSAKTGADGTFVLDGLSSGTFNIVFYAKEDAPFVVPALESVSVSVGKPLQLPDARAVEGVVVGGQVLASDTKTPVAGVYIGMQGALNPESSASVSSTITDEKGEWKTRTIPGKTMVYLQGVPSEFGIGKDQQRKRSEIGAAGDQNIDFEIERLPKIAGRLLDENGKPIKASLTFLQPDQTYGGFYAQSDKNGDFTAYGPTPGEWKIAVSGAWETVGAPRVQVERDKALEVRLKPANPAALEIGVYDDNDNAVEGARVIVQLLTDTPDGQGAQVDQREVVTDKAGRAVVENIGAKQRIDLQSVSKNGFDTAPLAKPSRTEKVWDVSLTLIKRSGRAQGLVFNPQGKAEAGALVSGSGVSVRTDNAGHFLLAPLHKGITDVFAWDGDAFALGSSDQTRLDLKAQALEPTNRAKAREILSALAEQTKSLDYYGRDALQLEVGSFDEVAPKLQNTKWRGIETLLARFRSDDTISNARWFAVLSEEKSAGQRLYNLSKWIKMRREIKSDDDSRAFLKALQSDVAQIEPQFKDDNKWQFAHGIFAAAAFAEKIGELQTADDLFSRAGSFQERAYGKERDRDVGIIGSIVGASPRLLTKAATLLPDDNSNRALMLSDGAEVIARDFGLDAARPFLLQIQNAPKPKPDSYGDTFSTDSMWHEATIKSIRLGGKSNPQLALELASSLPKTSDFDGYDARDRSLSEAAFFQTPDAARTLWRESLPRLEPSKAMGFLVEIKERDEPFARELYENFARDADAQPAIDAGINYIPQLSFNTPAFAFYEARFNPARARFRLERGFANVQNAPNSGEDLATYAKAMVMFDAARAVGWTAKLTAPNNDPSGNFETRRRIAQWLALDEKSRQHTGFAGSYSQDWDFEAR